MIRVSEHAANANLNNVPDSVFFIVGCERSGTTLMRSILRKHPELNVFANEPQYMRQIYEQFGDQITDIPKALEFIFGHSKFRRNWVDPSVILTSFEGATSVETSEFFYRFFGHYFNKYADRPLVLKDPHLIRNLNIIRKVFHRSEVKAVQLIRDPRAVVSSISARWKKRSIFSASAAWRDAARAGRRWRENNSSSYLSIRYEDLIVEPEHTVKQVCEFFGIQYYACMMDVSYKIETWGGDAKGQSKVERFDGFDVSRLDRWRSFLSDSDVELVERVCRAEMAYGDYPRFNEWAEMQRSGFRYYKELFGHTKTRLWKALHAGKNRSLRLLRNFGTHKIAK